jgi:hypothetical protein
LLGGLIGVRPGLTLIGDRTGRLGTGAGVVQAGSAVSPTATTAPREAVPTRWA